MARCYHDQEEFESDLTIEVAREDDILKESQTLKSKRCKKNPGHRDFIPFKDLTLEHLPEAFRNTETLDNLKQKGSRVVRLVVGRTLGSGCVVRLNDKYFITTNNHVVRTENDVKRCKVEFHYDDDSRSSVITSRGVELTGTDPYRDLTAFTFHPVPDFLYQLDYEDNYRPFVTIMIKNNQIISFPTIPTSSYSYFTRLNLNSSDIHLMFITYPDGFIGYFKSSYFKFKPIPSNIQELTSVEVYIDEEDGKSRVMPGHVLKFGDDFGVQISESIFQDEVKKCRVVWNGGVVGRGTRLYFNQCEPKDNRNMHGVDKEILNVGWWVFHFHPQKVFEHKNPIQQLDNVCCISHPHGAMKHITFGKGLGYSLERFDNKLRLIKTPEHDCKCKEVYCMKYSCKTCPGSSGSPVILLYDLNSGLHITHFLGETGYILIDGEQKKVNINRCWTSAKAD